MARHLTESLRSGKLHFDPRSTVRWAEVRALWDAVHSGHEEWGVQAYDGGLFSSDPAVSAAGGALGEIELTDADLGPALSALLVDEAPEGPGPADVRSLSVREFGTVSEGLLESSVSIAPSDLTIDTKGTYLPAKPGHEVLVGAGEVYFHNRNVGTGTVHLVSGGSGGRSPSTTGSGAVHRPRVGSAMSDEKPRRSRCPSSRLATSTSSAGLRSFHAQWTGRPRSAPSDG